MNIRAVEWRNSLPARQAPVGAQAVDITCDVTCARCEVVDSRRGKVVALCCEMRLEHSTLFKPPDDFPLIVVPEFSETLAASTRRKTRALDGVQMSLALIFLSLCNLDITAHRPLVCGLSFWIKSTQMNQVESRSIQSSQFNS